MGISDLSLIIFNIGFIPVCIASGLFVTLALISLRVDKQTKVSHSSPLKNHPFITVQVPSFNDPVAIRCLEACLKFSYPKDRYEIMILDDSTDQHTANILAVFAKRHSNMVRFFHRDNREGYKPGALKTWMPEVRGEIIVIFDADFVPGPDFLERIVQPFEDPQVAIVQGRQASFLNGQKNLVTRFASYLFYIHYYVIMPINNRCNSVFFCGTAGALRKQAVEEVGGWNTTSITEDHDLSVRLLSRGYRSVFLPLDIPSEVPVTIKGFLRQHMRWCFGNARVFIDHSRFILSKSLLTLKQRIMICFITMGSLITPWVIIMSLGGFFLFVVGNPEEVNGVWYAVSRILLTSGFLIMGLVVLLKRGNAREFPYFVVAALSLGFMLTCAVALAVYRAVFRKDEPLFAEKTSWICTPKPGNEQFGQSFLRRA